MPGRNLRVAGLLIVCAAAFSSSSAEAANTAVPPYWTCSASLASVSVAGMEVLDPLHANTLSDGACHDDSGTLPTLMANDILGEKTVSLAANVAQAQTALVNAGGPNGKPKAADPYLQAPSAVGQVGNVDLNVGGGALHITAKAIRSYVSAHCNPITHAPVLESGNSVQYDKGVFPDGSQVGGQVLDLRINGTPIPADGQPDAALTQLFDALSPLAPIISVKLNQVYKNADQSITREAVRIEALTAPGSAPLLTVVLGRVNVGRKDDVCKVPPGVTPPTEPINPVSFPPGGNQPGSYGGGNNNGAISSNNGNSQIVYVNKNSGAPNGTNASECAHLRMFFDPERVPGKIATRGPKSITSTMGTRRVIRGSIRNCKGKAIVNAKIALVHIIHGKRHLVKTGLRSRSGGKLTIILPNNLTTRSLVFQYRAFINDKRIAAKSHLRIKVRTRSGTLT